jgi:hypothetical protein
MQPKHNPLYVECFGGMLAYLSSKKRKDVKEKKERSLLEKAKNCQRKFFGEVVKIV